MGLPPGGVKTIIFLTGMHQSATVTMHSHGHLRPTAPTGAKQPLAPAESDILRCSPKASVTEICYLHRRKD